MRWTQYVIFLTVLFCCSCSKKYVVFDLNDERVERIKHDRSTKTSIITDSLYIKRSAVKYIRAHIHFCLPKDYSFDKNTDLVFQAEELLKEANRRLFENDPMNLPLGNRTSVYDSKIRWAFASTTISQSVFIHRYQPDHNFIKKGKHANRYDRSQLDSLLRDKENVVNIFLLPFDANQLASGEQKIEITGIALGTIVKLAGFFESSKPISEFAGILNHELGHILGLRHTWNTNDFCPDTPRNANCWNFDNTAPCDKAVSNNLMDYNAYQSAITPCQIRRMHDNIAKANSRLQRLMNWPHQNTLSSIVIDHHEVWNRPLIIENDIRIIRDGTLEVSSALLLAPGVKIEVDKGASLILKKTKWQISSEEAWEGIVLKRGAKIYSDTESQLPGVRRN